MTLTRHSVRLAVPIVWAVAMLAARVLDPWIPIAIAAVGMSATVLSIDRELLQHLFRPAARTLALGLAAAVLMVAATYLSFPLLVRAFPAIGVRTHDLYSMFLTGRLRSSVVLFVIPIVAAEEILWRGAFQEWIATRFSSQPWLIVAVTAAVYAIAHAPFGSLLLVIIAFVCALFWSALRAISGSLLPPLMAHLAWDLALILIPLHRVDLDAH